MPLWRPSHCLLIAYVYAMLPRPMAAASPNGGALLLACQHLHTLAGLSMLVCTSFTWGSGQAEEQGALHSAHISVSGQDSLHADNAEKWTVEDP